MASLPPPSASQQCRPLCSSIAVELSARSQEHAPRRKCRNGSVNPSGQRHNSTDLSHITSRLMNKDDYSQLWAKLAKNGELMTEKHDPNDLTTPRSKPRSVIAAEL